MFFLSRSDPHFWEKYLNFKPNDKEALYNVGLSKENKAKQFLDKYYVTKDEKYLSLYDKYAEEACSWLKKSWDLHSYRTAYEDMNRILREREHIKNNLGKVKKRKKTITLTRGELATIMFLSFLLGFLLAILWGLIVLKDHDIVYYSVPTIQNSYNGKGNILDTASLVGIGGIVKEKVGNAFNSPREKSTFNPNVNEEDYFLWETAGEKIVRNYPVALGKEGKTPSGEFYINKKIMNPNKDIPLGKNPYGTRAMELSNPDYAIHGTNKPDSIGKNISMGCIRLFEEDIEDLYSLTPLSTPVIIVDEFKPLVGLSSIEGNNTPNEAKRIEDDTKSPIETPFSRSGSGANGSTNTTRNNQSPTDNPTGNNSSANNKNNGENNPNKNNNEDDNKNDKGYPDNPDTINLYDKKDNPIEEDLATFYNWRA